MRINGILTPWRMISVKTGRMKRGQTIALQEKEGKTGYKRILFPLGKKTVSIKKSECFLRKHALYKWKDFLQKKRSDDIINPIFGFEKTLKIRRKTGE